MDNVRRAAICEGMDADVLITGGGLTGTALALALAQSGFSVIMVDALPKATRRKRGFDGRSYALSAASCRLLDALGLWERVAGEAQPIHEIKVSDGRPGERPSPFVMEFDQSGLGDGAMGHLVEDRHLRLALLDAEIAEDRITHLPKETVTAQEVGAAGVTVTLASDKTLTARLLVGCDGKRSGTAVRAGIKRIGWEYGQTSLVCAVEHDLPHHGVAHQLFLPAGPLAILPLTKNRSSIVWTERREEAARLAAADETAYLNHLRPRFGSFLGEIKLVGDRFTYPLELSIAQAFIAERVALVGDAAHAIHPIAGQGLNAGLKDVAALVEVLTEAARRGEDIAAPLVLARYQTWRRFDTATLALATDTFNRLFSNDNPVLRGLRDLGMGVVCGLPGLQRRFMREAAGLSGDVPRLMTGQPL
ncbi:MAG: FAD-dependent monooxygenase [Shimia sp.]